MIPAEQADAVTLHHVLEHTADPMSGLQQIWMWLKPDGVAAIEVPNLASWAHAPHHRFHRAHLHTFSHIVLEDALTNNALAIVHMSPPVDLSHLNVIARKTSPLSTRTWSNSAGENHATLATHTRLAHILSGQPLRRLHASITRPLSEARAIRALGDPESGRKLLDALFAERR